MKSIEDHLNELTPFLRDVVVVYIVDKANKKVIFGERKKLDRPGLGKRVGIGGGVELGEDRLQSVFREVIEEIGTKENGDVVFELKSAQQVGVVYFLFPHKKDSPGYNQRCYIFLSDDYSGTPIETKDIKPEWYPINNLPEEFMWKDNLLWVPQVLAGQNFNGVFVYDENNQIVDYKLES